VPCERREGTSFFRRGLKGAMKKVMLRLTKPGLRSACWSSQAKWCERASLARVLCPRSKLWIRLPDSQWCDAMVWLARVGLCTPALRTEQATKPLDGFHRLSIHA